MSLQRWSGSNWLLHCARCHVEANRGQRGCQHLQLPETHQVRAHNMFSRFLKLQILNFLFVIACEKNGFLEKKITVILAFFNLFWFLNQNKQQISWKKFRFCIFRIRENMWWTRYRAQRAHLVQTEEQYIFIHDALVEVIEAGETHINKTALPRYIHSLQCIDVTDEKNHPPKVLEKQHKVCFFLGYLK